jgi:hypothetical protein
MGIRISTPTNILIKTKNTAMSILICTITNTSISTSTNTITRMHQMCTIMSIKVNTVLTIMAILDTKQKFISIRIKRLKKISAGTLYRALWK